MKKTATRIIPNTLDRFSYGLRLAVAFIVLVILMVPISSILGQEDLSQAKATAIVLALSLILVLWFCYLLLFLQLPRIRDAGMPALMILLMFIPGINVLLARVRQLGLSSS